MSTAVLQPHHSYPTGIAASGERWEALGVIVLRAGLGLIFLWFGAIKFTGIGAAPFLVNSPLLSWLPATFGLQGASNFLGVFELTTGVLLWAGFAKPILSAIGGAMAAFTFLMTLSSMFSTPGVAEPLAGGFPALSAIPGQFLLKDVGLFGIAIFIAGESWWRARSAGPASSLATGRPPTTVGPEAGVRIMAIGTTAMRYGLALIFLWYGAMKFTSYEATGIAPFIANSPLVGWWHATLGIQGASTMLGVYEITTAVLLAVCPVAPRAGVVGAAMAVLTFLTTLSFLFSTPGVIAPVGFPVLSDLGEFLLKDVGLLGISILLLGYALRSVAGRPEIMERARA